MSKIGRKPITLTSATVDVSNGLIKINGPKAQISHELPAGLSIKCEGKKLTISLQDNSHKGRMVWGLHRALLANKIIGAERGFEQTLKIVGLGFKAQLSGRKLAFALGYSHKIEYDLPAGVDIEVDKTGQLLVAKSADKFLLGNVCDAIRSLRPPEPYKGTGIIRNNETIIRKAGKTKSA